MFRKLRSRFREYCERNEAAHKRAAVGVPGEGLKQAYDLPDLPEDVAEALRAKDIDDLYVLEILNDDLTPIGVVIELVHLYCLQPYALAKEIAFNTHNKGQSQAVTGPKQALETISSLIESSARKLKHPLKCRVVKI